MIPLMQVSPARLTAEDRAAVKLFSDHRREFRFGSMLERHRAAHEFNRKFFKGKPYRVEVVFLDKVVSFERLYKVIV